MTSKEEQEKEEFWEALKGWCCGKKPSHVSVWKQVTGDDGDKVMVTVTITRCDQCHKLHKRTEKQKPYDG